MAERGLRKELKLLDIFCLASGAMISSGIFILPGLAYARAGPLVFVSYFLAGVLALMGTFSIIELATAMPKAGGDYFFITRSLGPFVGTVSSFLSWTALCLKSAFAIFGIAEMLYLLAGIPFIISSLFLCLFFVGLNIFGVKASARFEVVLVIGLFAIMLLFMMRGMGMISEDNFFPFLAHGLNPLLATAGFVFISFGGLLNIASVSGEVQNPSRNIPRGMIFSVFAVTVLYTAVLIVVVGVLPGDVLSGSLTPIADAGRVLFGNTGYMVISLGALIAFITTANAGIMAASRYPLALSQDNLLPGIIRTLTKRKQSPALAVSLTGLFIFICLLLDLATLVKLGSAVILTLYILTNAAVVILREGKVQNYRPSFKVPLYPWTNFAGMFLFTLLILDMGIVAIEVSVSVVGLAVLTYFFYGRRRHNIEYALLHVIERIINRKITSTTLEEELKQVIIHRDDIQIDRFHRLVEDALVIDIGKKMVLDAFLAVLAQKVCGEIGLREEEIIHLFEQREREGSTAITPFIAVPHIIIPGQNNFRLVIIRCREGIAFSHDNPAVRAVFVLFGTRDERTFHLKVLSAIAHIVQNRMFEKAWLGAKDENQLKDIVLLSDRKRHERSADL